MAEIAKQAGIAKSVISYLFADKNELMREIIRTGIETYTKSIESRIAVEPTASGKIRAYLAASADFMALHRSHGNREDRVQRARTGRAPSEGDHAYGTPQHLFRAGPPRRPGLRRTAGIRRLGHGRAA
jgi:AcrR family transcriptional regulator